MSSERSKGRRSTFRARLSVDTTLLFLIILILTNLCVFLGVKRALQSNLDHALLHIAKVEVPASLEEPKCPLMKEITPVGLHLKSGSGYERYAQLMDHSGNIISRTDNLKAGPDLTTNDVNLQIIRDNKVHYRDIVRNGEPLRLLFHPLKDQDGQQLFAIVAVSRRPMQRSLLSIIYVLLSTLLLGAATAGFAVERLARRLTQPLSEIAETTRQIGEQNLSARIPEMSPDAELQDLTAGLNRMLARLERAFESQRQFVSDASHELRTPLSNLSGTLEVALRRPRTLDEYEETLKISLSETARLTRLVNDLLTLSRADSGRVQLQLTACNLAEIARQSLAAVKRSAGETSINISDKELTPAWIEADCDRIREVIDNLLDNALRYAPAGSVITLRSWNCPGRSYFQIEDEGPGIAPENLECIFLRFFRPDQSRSRNSGGMGLGLAITQTIMQAHHGTICAENRLEGGARFLCSFPALDDLSTV